MESNSDRNKQDRTFLHDIATPLSTLSLILRRLAKMNANNDEKFDRLVKQAMDSVQKIEEFHGNQKMLISQRESEDTKTPAKSA